MTDLQMPREHRAKTLKPFVISKSDGHAVAKGVEKVVFSVAIFVPDAEALDLIKQVVPRVPLIDDRLVESMLSIFDKPAMHITRNGNGSFVLAQCRELRFNRIGRHPSSCGLLQQ